MMAPRNQSVQTEVAETAPAQRPYAVRSCQPAFRPGTSVCQSGTPLRRLPLHVINHIHPQSRGGPDTLYYLQLMCYTCHAIKGNRSMEYLREQLRWRGILSL